MDYCEAIAQSPIEYNRASSVRFHTKTLYGYTYRRFQLVGPLPISSQPRLHSSCEVFKEQIAGSVILSHKLGDCAVNELGFCSQDTWVSRTGP